MFQDLLLPLTGGRLDALALRHARSVAQAAGARIHLMHVLEAPGLGFGYAAPVDAVEWHARRQEAEAYLEVVAAELRETGLEVDYALKEGRPAEHIIQQAHEGADLIVLPTGGFGHDALGSMCGQVLWRSYVSTLVVRGDAPWGAGGDVSFVPPRRVRRASTEWETVPQAVPVLVEAATAVQTVAEAPPSARGAAVQEPGVPGGPPLPVAGLEGAEAGLAPVVEPLEEPARYGTVLVALDGSRRSECVLPALRAVVDVSAARIVLAHVVEEPALPRLLPPAPEELELVQRIVAANEEAAQAYLEDVRSGLGVNAEIRIKAGRSVAPALHALVGETGADLVVMSAHGYGDDQTLPFGTVATNFIGYSRAALLVVHDVPWSQRSRELKDLTEEAWAR